MLTQHVDLFDSTYGHFTEGVLATIRRETFGQDIGQNSWLTVEEYDRFISWLKLRPEQHVLEVASVDEPFPRSTACVPGVAACPTPRQARCLHRPKPAD
jgi:hypothetical protein